MDLIANFKMGCFRNQKKIGLVCNVVFNPLFDGMLALVIIMYFNEWEVFAESSHIDGREMEACLSPKLPKHTLGFKSFDAAEATITGIELHRMFKKGQLENAGHTSAWK